MATNFSKTSTPCDCGWIAQALEDSASSGIYFCEEENRFLLCCVGTGCDGGWLLYHCPFCGGVFPDSSRPVWVPRLSPDERALLKEMCVGHTSAESIISRLGPPDYDKQMLRYQEEDGEFVLDTSIAPTRNIEYYGLSEVADLEFYVSEDDSVTGRIVMKRLSPRHKDAPEARAMADRKYSEYRLLASLVSVLVAVLCLTAFIFMLAGTAAFGGVFRESIYLTMGISLIAGLVRLTIPSGSPKISVFCGFMVAVIGYFATLAYAVSRI